MQDRDEHAASGGTPEEYDRPMSPWELRQQEKLQKQAEAIQRRQEELVERHREAVRRDAERQARIRAKEEEREARRRAKQEEREAREREKQAAKEAAERARQEAKEAAERAKQEAREAAERARQEKIEAAERARQEASEARERAKQEAREARERIRQEAFETVERARQQGWPGAAAGTGARQDGGTPEDSWTQGDGQSYGNRMFGNGQNYGNCQSESQGNVQDQGNRRSESQGNSHGYGSYQSEAWGNGQTFGAGQHDGGSPWVDGQYRTVRPSGKPSSRNRKAVASGRKAGRALGKEKKPETISVQNSIPYKEMARDGICRVRDKLYSKTVQFYDINYQLAQNEDKNAIFEGWCDFLNYFDSSIQFQISFINHKTDLRDFEKQLKIEPRGDAFDDVRMEYSQMLREQFEKGKNGLMRTKYITFSIEAENIREARPRLERIETDILNNFKVLGVKALPLNGVERLKILYETFNPEQNLPFLFKYEQLRGTGLTTKDFVAPTSFSFKSGRYFWMGETIGAVSYLQILSAEFGDDVVKCFLEIDKDLIINLHVKAIDHIRALKMVKGKMTEIDSRKIDEQKRAFRSGYDMDILPSDLNAYGNSAKTLLDDLQSRNERLFLVTVLFLNTAKTKQELETAIMQTSGVAQIFNSELRRLDFQQEAGLMSSLPLGQNLIPISRMLTTTSTAVFVPFTTQELFMGGESLYYGLNALSNNMIMVDRKLLKNPNGMIIGTPGSGKSFAAKREIANVFFVTDDDVIICDPEGEYYPLVRALGGQVIQISATSHDYINPMDINFNYSEDDSPLGFKSDFILSLCELIMGSRHGIEAEEKSVIDRCLPIVYQKYFMDPVPENMPTLGDLYDALRKQPEVQAQRIATALEIYVNGSLKVFNHQTNVELGNRIVCFDIKDLGKQLKKLGMLIVQDQVWNRVTVNRYSNKSTRYYVDEFHLLLKEEQTAQYSVGIWKRFRKWGGIPTGITQNIKDLLASREIENIFEDSEFIYMLNQAAGDRQILARHLNISPRQLSHVTNSNEGEGLMFCENVIIPFKDHFRKDLKLYSLMTSKPVEVEQRMKEEAARRRKKEMAETEVLSHPVVDDQENTYKS